MKNNSSEYLANVNKFTFAPEKSSKVVIESKGVKLVTVIKFIVVVLSCVVLFELIK